MILIIIKFCELLLQISPRIINSLRSYIKHSKECFLLFPNTSQLVKETRLRLVFPTYFSVFGNRRKHSSSCLIYYILNGVKTNIEERKTVKNMNKPLHHCKTVVFYRILTITCHLCVLALHAICFGFQTEKCTTSEKSCFEWSGLNHYGLGFH